MNANAIRLTLTLAFSLTTLSVLSATPPPTDSGSPVQIVVTAAPHKGAQTTALNSSDVTVFEGKAHDQIAAWTPAQGDHADLEFFIMIDDSDRDVVATQFSDIKNFIAAQPPTTKIGIAYMQNGRANIVQNLTEDRNLAAKAIRLPFGYPGANPSPYFALSDLVKHWPEDSARHEVLMITNGFDPYYGIGDMNDPYLEASIKDAQRAGVIVSAIYEPEVGGVNRRGRLTFWGQMYLSKLAQETGGAAYYIGFNGQAPDFTPFLKDLSYRLDHQYILAFVPETQKKPGMRYVKVKTGVHDIDLATPAAVYVPATH